MMMRVTLTLAIELKSRELKRRPLNLSIRDEDLMSLESSEEEEEEEVHSYQYITPSVSAPDSGSKIERIIGRRVLPNTKEAEEIMRRSRYAIVSKNERIHSRAFIAITLQNQMMLV